MRFRTILATLGAATFCLIASTQGMARAQPAGDEKNKPEREDVHLEGKIEDFGPSLLKIKDSAGETFLIKVEADPKNISMSGKAEPSFLSRGMVVRFTARLDRKGEAVESLGELTVFTPREDERPGVALVQNLSAAASGVFSDPPEEKPAKPKKSTANAPQNYHVIGVVSVQKNGKIQVAAGDFAIKATLADKARISVDVADLRLARLGDTARIDGWRYPAQKSQVFATRVSITAAEPFQGAGKPKPRPSRTAAGEGKPAPEPAPPNR